MKPIYHFTASLALGLAVFACSRSFWAFWLGFLPGVFIDLDHLIDYWALKPPHPFNVKEFLDSEKYDEQKRYLFVFLHSWEWVALLWIAAYYLGWPVYFLAFTLSITLHLLMDIANTGKHKLHPLSYFFVFRILRKFRK